MARSTLQHKRLLRVGKASRKLLQNWAEGVSLCQDSGGPLKNLVLQAASDRWTLARAHRRDGNRLLGCRTPLYRCAVNRFYYAMYHCLRAVVYLEQDGDDYEAHSTLPQHVPSDFPDRGDWVNRLKNARLARNAADYDPYPKSDKAWRMKALGIQTDADALLPLTRVYLRGKGYMIS